MSKSHNQITFFNLIRTVVDGSHLSFGHHRPHSRDQQKGKSPRQFPAGGFAGVSSLSGSEVALNANVQEDRALVLELVHGYRLRSCDSRTDRADSARELLVEEERTDFTRERQVLDGSPTGDNANLSNVVVRVAASNLQSRVLPKPKLAQACPLAERMSFGRHRCSDTA